MDLSVIQINSRQYLVKPGSIVEVDKLLTNEKTLNIDQVLLTVEKGKVEIGKPFLKKTLSFEVLENVQKPKIRVSVYKAKANFRKVRGQKREMSRIKLVEDKSVKK
ncbi:MAG: 50S ribosomal protein L21 [Candidatus Daviesbacteria bacterium]|nr:50S ribosomal protein L21 [Candidatus Daviesbacteria bacterium]